jgi:hypothetical protein
MGRLPIAAIGEITAPYHPGEEPVVKTALRADVVEGVSRPNTLGREGGNDYVPVDDQTYFADGLGHQND